MRRLRGLAFLMLAAAMLALPPARGDSAAAGQRALVLGSTASSAAARRPHRARVRAARPDEVGIIVLRMNTPGGLDASMRQIVSAIPRLAGAGRDPMLPRTARVRRRRHLYRLRERDRGDGPGHQYRRRHANPARRPSDGASRPNAAKEESG
jgi:hypothetical protein